MQRAKTILAVNGLYLWWMAVVVASIWSVLYDGYGLDALLTAFGVGFVVALWTLPLPSFFAHFYARTIRRGVRYMLSRLRRLS